MFSQGKVKTEVIFHNVITGGMPDFVRNREVKKFSATSVKILNGQG